jgi:peptide-methionine (S)-S-oxide reductase
VKGVASVRAGYAGGAAATARYELVGTETTGHAESVEVKYDPARVTYGTLLRVFFSVAHDPTQLNRQGPDSGPSYRSAIFPVDSTQAGLARAYIAQLSAAKVWPGKIVTTIEPGKTFYPAEAYHQNFLNQNPDYPYIVVNDLPKLAAFKRLLPQLWNEKSAA